MNLINTLLLGATFILFQGCENQPPASNQTVNQTTDTATIPIVGADKDEHGCKGSAGYTWSVLKNDCIRIFETGVRLDPVAPGLDKTLSAFVVFKSLDDDSKAELFIPNQTNSLILEKSGKEDAGTWANDTLSLSQWKGMYILSDKNDQTLYKGAIVK